MGATASAEFYNWASKADDTATLFLNDYNTIEESGDKDSIPAKYLQKLRDIQGFPELDVVSGPNQASYLEQILREVHSHPKIQGIVIWAAWKPSGCYRMCLTDNNFKNLPTGDVVDKLTSEFGLTSGLASGTTNANGFFEASLFHGDYEVKITHPLVDSPFVRGLNVAPTTESQQQLHVQLNA
ncbi:hypothetical protein ACFX14_003434 [Malus domestica]